MKNIYVITGGTMVHVTPHFSMCAPAYGKVGEDIYTKMMTIFNQETNEADYNLHLIKTRMAGLNSSDTIEHLSEIGFNSSLETNDDLQSLIGLLCLQESTAGIIMAAAICDFTPKELQAYEGTERVTINEFGKDKKRLHKAHSLSLKLNPSNKIIDLIKTKRPDIFLVTFKTTAGSSEEELVKKALHNLTRSQSDIVFGNDIHNKINVIVSSDESTLRGTDRQSTLDLFCSDMFGRLTTS